MTFAYFEAEAGAAPVHEHDHPQEEVWSIIDGELEVTIGGASKVIGPGSVAIVPAGVRHSVRVRSACRAIVVDYPTREQIGQAQTGRRESH